MADLVRTLNVRGREEFHDFLARARSGDPPMEVPSHLLQDPRFTEELPAAIPIRPNVFTTGLESARTLSGIIRQLPQGRFLRDPGLWSWLSLYYFDSVCPVQAGARNVRSPSRYVWLDASDAWDWKTCYRHLLWMRWFVYEVRQQSPARLLLAGPCHVWSEPEEQLCARQEFVTNLSLLEAADHLYWDVGAGHVKTGVSGKGGGTPRRLALVMQQLDLTYDLKAMTAGQILSLLPPEFDRWR